MANSQLLLLFLSLIVSASADLAKDRAECTEQLLEMVTCLPYVGGNGAKVPTPDCCAGLKSVLLKSPKCLCVLIRDRNDPALGLKIDLDLALSLPSLCKAPANPNVSECPKLLNLPPNSPEAAVFKQPGNAAESNSTGSSGNLKGTPESSGARSRHMGTGRKMWMEVEMVGGILLLLLMPFMIFT